MMCKHVCVSVYVCVCNHIYAMYMPSTHTSTWHIHFSCCVCVCVCALLYLSACCYRLRLLGACKYASMQVFTHDKCICLSDSLFAWLPLSFVTCRLLMAAGWVFMYDFYYVFFFCCCCCCCLRAVKSVAVLLVLRWNKKRNANSHQLQSNWSAAILKRI